MQQPRWTTIFEVVDPLIKTIPSLKEYSTEVTKRLHTAVLEGGDRVRAITDLLHGIALGHPLHPLLTDIPVGAWTFSALYDVLSILMPFNRKYKDTADQLTALGVVSSIPTAIAGLADYSTIKEEASEYGLLHGILNVSGLLLYILSWRARRRNQRLTGIGYAMLGMTVITASAWLGGEMVYRLRVGANHSPDPETPEKWTPVLPSSEIVEGQPQAVDVDGQRALLYRDGDGVHAISAVCAHAGGPLDEGKFYDGCVECPWHNSIFDLKTGQVVHGPAVFPQPRYEVRITNGQIRLRAPQENAEQ
ncbi:MAG: Rieske 2Fe-2S domain-containing protein [Chloroflexota bacterium]